MLFLEKLKGKAEHVDLQASLPYFLALFKWECN